MNKFEEYCKELMVYYDSGELPKIGNNKIQLGFNIEDELYQKICSGDIRDCEFDYLKWDGRLD